MGEGLENKKSVTTDLSVRKTMVMFKNSTKWNTSIQFILGATKLLSHATVKLAKYPLGSLEHLLAAIKMSVSCGNIFKMAATSKIEGALKIDDVQKNFHK